MSKAVWIKIEGEEDEQASRVFLEPGAIVDDLQRLLYKDPVFAFVPGTIQCLLVRDAEGGEKVVGNRDVVDTSLAYEVRLKPSATTETLEEQLQTFKEQLQTLKEQLQIANLNNQQLQKVTKEKQEQQKVIEHRKQRQRQALTCQRNTTLMLPTLTF
eukprot:TRINITY_DN330_c0_g1_i15.p1 TRINITY_DN330_c0_g1~~TRINITY_DN330_c0_g1_i15.p1  ORF type:complete len:157 (-),score=31.04 TRINITY_DN330_c0_g1_i15:438-908(-)